MLESFEFFRVFVFMYIQNCTEIHKENSPYEGEKGACFGICSNFLLWKVELSYYLTINQISVMQRKYCIGTIRLYLCVAEISSSEISIGRYAPESLLYVSDNNVFRDLRYQKSENDIGKVRNWPLSRIAR